VDALWWMDYDEESRVGFRGSGPPIGNNRHLDAVLTAEGSEQLRNYQIHRPDKSRHRMKYATPSKAIALNMHCAGEKRFSVLELCERKKFSRNKFSGTPSFSLIANQTDDLFTINAFS
jgi:hypothetical protein